MKLQEFAAFLPHSEQDIRTTTTPDGTLWFALPDVCAALQLRNPVAVASRLDDDEKLIQPIRTPKGARMPMWTVTEPGLYSIVLGLRGPSGRSARKSILRAVVAGTR